MAYKRPGVRVSLGPQVGMGGVPAKGGQVLHRRRLVFLRRDVFRRWGFSIFCLDLQVCWLYGCIGLLGWGVVIFVCLFLVSVFFSEFFCGLEPNVVWFTFIVIKSFIWIYRF